MKNSVQNGITLTFTAGADLSSGDGVLLGAGGLFGVVSYDVLNGEEGEAVTEGVFELPKATADTPAAFAVAYWDDSNSELTTVSTSNTQVGYFTEAYGAGILLANVRLTP